MAIRVYDYRNDIRNLEIMPEIRSRFIYLEPHEVHSRHSHDLGHEVFLVLDGHVRFDVAGETVDLLPGQFCLVRANELHQASNPDDVPATMYLSVTPHIEPTHTFWDDHGQKLPPRYGGSTAKERAERTAPGPNAGELAERQQEALRALVTAVDAAADDHEQLLGQLLQQLSAASDAAHESTAQHAAGKATLDALWLRLFPIFRDTAALAGVWNELAAAATPRQG